MKNKASRPYYEWTSLAERWSKCVDFGSPISAWSQEMFDEDAKARSEGRTPSMNNVKRDR